MGGFRLPYSELHCICSGGKKKSISMQQFKLRTFFFWWICAHIKSWSVFSWSRLLFYTSCHIYVQPEWDFMGLTGENRHLVPPQSWKKNKPICDWWAWGNFEINRNLMSCWCEHQSQHCTSLFFSEFPIVTDNKGSWIKHDKTTEACFCRGGWGVGGVHDVITEVRQIQCSQC